MQKSISTIIASIFLVLGGAAACRSVDSAQHPDFFVQATKDGAPWMAAGTGTFSKTSQQFTVLGQAGDAARAEVLELGFAVAPPAALASARALPASWRVLLGYDAVIDSYATATQEKVPTLEITRLDTVGKIVEGRFTAGLVRDKQWTSQPQTLRLTDGSFRVRYTEVP